MAKVKPLVFLDMLFAIVVAVCCVPALCFPSPPVVPIASGLVEGVVSGPVRLDFIWASIKAVFKRAVCLDRSARFSRGSRMRRTLVARIVGFHLSQFHGMARLMRQCLALAAIRCAKTSSTLLDCRPLHPPLPQFAFCYDMILDF
jgi:hypothetical protein